MKKKTVFEITEDHLKLLDRMWVGWESCEFGAPAIDCKRPYGNSFVYGDIAEIIGIEFDEDHEFNDEQIERMNKLHKEMQTVLQILVVNARTGITVGSYECEEYGTNWKRMPK